MCEFPVTADVRVIRISYPMTNNMNVYAIRISYPLANVRVIRIFVLYDE